jgi:nucleotide-binding universal stress UspA family protein
MRVKGVIVQGEPDTAIADYARDWGADLIVIGSSDRSAIARLLAGSVSQSVVQHAPCSVLVIKQSEEEQRELIEAHTGATPADATV